MFSTKNVLFSWKYNFSFILNISHRTFALKIVHKHLKLPQKRVLFTFHDVMNFQVISFHTISNIYHKFEPNTILSTRCIRKSNIRENRNSSLNSPREFFVSFFITTSSTYNDERWWCLVSMSLHIIFKPLNMNQNGAFFSRQSFNGCMFDVFKEPPHLFNWLFLLPSDWFYVSTRMTNAKVIHSFHSL